MSKYSTSMYSRRSFLQVTGAAAVAVSFGGRVSAASDQLNVYNWDTYIGNTTLDTFTEKTGVKVQYDLYANLEEMFAKFQAGNPGYDVIFPSDYMIETMIAADMLEELDRSLLPNFKHIDANFLDPAFDPGCKYNIPYFWGSCGIGYRKSKVGKVDSWKVLLESEEFAGRMALLADQRFVMGVALLYLGYSANTTNPDEINAARDLLIKAKKNLKGFVPDSGQDMLISGDIDVVMEWNGDVLKVMEEDDDLTYVIPKEGTVIWVDGVCIPKGGPNIENAYKFLNHLHEPQVNAEVANTVHYATSNKSAHEFVSKDDLNNPAIYAPDDVVARSQALSDVGDALPLYDAAWTAIQAA
ncbi:MAG: extracellular solute-binding protein [Gammaproteobacteria bacterium]|nr:extracellular solute-binding protein [Gammaproteobacteria bacterium]